MAKRPRVITKCVADVHCGPGERIVEFSFPSGQGGLISFRTDREGRDIVDVYRVDAAVVIKHQ